MSGNAERIKRDTSGTGDVTDRETGETTAGRA